MTVIAVALSAVGAGAFGWAGWYFLFPDTPRRALRDLQDAACAGDANRFWLRVDRTSVATHMRMSERLAKARTGLDPIPEALLDRHVEEALRELEREVSQGSVSVICRGKPELLDRDVVWWTDPHGKGQRGRLERSGRRYRVVELSLPLR